MATYNNSVLDSHTAYTIKWSIYSHYSICREILCAEITDSDGTSSITVKCEFNVELSRFSSFYIIFTTLIETFWWSNKSQWFLSDVNKALQCLCWLIGLWRRIWELKMKCFQKMYSVSYTEESGLPWSYDCLKIITLGLPTPTQTNL